MGEAGLWRGERKDWQTQQTASTIQVTPQPPQTQQTHVVDVRDLQAIAKTGNVESLKNLNQFYGKPIEGIPQGATIIGIQETSPQQYSLAYTLAQPEPQAKVSYTPPKDVGEWFGRGVAGFQEWGGGIITRFKEGLSVTPAERMIYGPMGVVQKSPPITTASIQTLEGVQFWLREMPTDVRIPQVVSPFSGQAMLLGPQPTKWVKPTESLAGAIELAYAPVGAVAVVESFWRPEVKTFSGSLGATVISPLRGGFTISLLTEYGAYASKHPFLFGGELIGEYLTAKYIIGPALSEVWGGIKQIGPVGKVVSKVGGFWEQKISTPFWEKMPETLQRLHFGPEYTTWKGKEMLPMETIIPQEFPKAGAELWLSTETSLATESTPWKIVPFKGVQTTPMSKTLENVMKMGGIPQFTMQEVLTKPAITFIPYAPSIGLQSFASSIGRFGTAEISGLALSSFARGIMRTETTTRTLTKTFTTQVMKPSLLTRQISVPSLISGQTQRQDLIALPSQIQSQISLTRTTQITRQVTLTMPKTMLKTLSPPKLISRPILQTRDFFPRARKGRGLGVSGTWFGKVHPILEPKQMLRKFR